MIPGTEWFPWEYVVSEDRGHESECWIWTKPLSRTARTVNIVSPVKRLFQQRVDPRPPGFMWMHDCERFGELNLCVRPDHIRVGTRSDNGLHHNRLRLAAGAPAATEGRKTGTRTPEQIANRVASLRRGGKMHDALVAIHQRQLIEGPYTCDECSREFTTPGGRTRHWKCTHNYEMLQKASKED